MTRPILLDQLDHELKINLQNTPWLKLPARLDPQVLEWLIEFAHGSITVGEVAAALPDLDVSSAHLWTLPAQSRTQLDPASSELHPTFHIVLTHPDSCRWIVDGRREVPAAPGDILIFDENSAHRFENDAVAHCLHLVVDGQWRRPLSELLQAARSQNGLRDLREAVNALFATHALRGTIPDKRSPLYLDLMNQGYERLTLLENHVALAVTESPATDFSLREELLHRVTLASLFPFEPTVLQSAQIPNWLEEQAENGKEYAAIVKAGSFVGEIPQFAANLLEASSRLLKGAQLTTTAGDVVLYRLPHSAMVQRSEVLDVGTQFCAPKGRADLDLQSIHRQIERRLSSPKRVFVFNTERLSSRPLGFSPCKLITPCAGLKPFALAAAIARNGPPISSALFIEHNDLAIDHYRNLLNCRDYAQVIAVQTAELRRQGLGPENALSYVEGLLDTVLKEGFAGSEQLFMQTLRHVASVAHLVRCDYFLDHETIVDEFIAGSYFWHSNAWESEPARYRFSTPALALNYRTLNIKIARRLGTDAWLHRDNYEVIFGREPMEPIAAGTSGVTRGPLNAGPYQLISPFDQTTSAI